MKSVPKVKVIKKDDQKVSENVETRPQRPAAREIVSTVTSWVSDFQARKRGETKIAIEKLLASRPQPSEL